MDIKWLEKSIPDDCEKIYIQDDFGSKIIIGYCKNSKITKQGFEAEYCRISNLEEQLKLWN